MKIINKVRKDREGKAKGQGRQALYKAIAKERREDNGE